MFSAQTYAARRAALKAQIPSGVLLFLGNVDSPFNYRANAYSFRQDSSFLYYFGLNEQHLAGIIDVDNDLEVLYADEPTMDDIIWSGELPKVAQKAESIAVSRFKPYADLAEDLRLAISQGREIHFLPPYRGETMLEFLRLGLNVSKPSAVLRRAIAEQRLVKEPQEIAEIERAMDTAYAMHTYVMRNARPQMLEQELAGAIEGIAISAGGNVSFPVILSINGQTLHNPFHNNLLEEGRLLLTDAGAETSMNYCSDITRTIPVSAQFTQQQKEVYQIVLDANMKVIDLAKPEMAYRDLHFEAARVLVDGLKSLGIMKGNSSEAILQGAHALFMPHGLGHPMGLDVHDMENIGEDFVGYTEKITRSKQFGLASLRFAREIKEGYVLTDEPGIYFIPALIDQWEAEDKHSNFINYQSLKAYRNFGGIRIEDDILITKTGCQVLGKPIPKTISEVENIRTT